MCPGSEGPAELPEPTKASGSRGASSMGLPASSRGRPAGSPAISDCAQAKEWVSLVFLGFGHNMLQIGPTSCLVTSSGC